VRRIAGYTEEGDDLLAAAHEEPGGIGADVRQPASVTLAVDRRLRVSDAMGVVERSR